MREGLTYQKTFFDLEPNKVDEFVNKFKEENFDNLIVTHGQCNTATDENGRIWFYTTIFYKKK